MSSIKKGREGASAWRCQSLEGEGEDNGYLSAGSIILRREGEDNMYLGEKTTIIKKEKRYMGAGTSIVKRERTHGCWDCNRQNMTQQL
ncbi:hypothetical protein TIFTF001_029913 [Ficus carica]|uniref:Uncharacterized protein n=1 Tax=Ficus carica TaxID=3494 RepID=A0AA88J469_FICCA|nr:hypothetical protein TIFTF001_029913 [Ficus carica]